MCFMCFGWMGDVRMSIVMHPYCCPVLTSSALGISDLDPPPHTHAHAPPCQCPCPPHPPHTWPYPTIMCCAARCGVRRPSTTPSTSCQWTPAARCWLQRHGAQQLPSHVCTRRYARPPRPPARRCGAVLRECDGLCHTTAVTHLTSFPLHPLWYQSDLVSSLPVTLPLL